MRKLLIAIIALGLLILLGWTLLGNLLFKSIAYVLYKITKEIDYTALLNTAIVTGLVVGIVTWLVNRSLSKFQQRLSIEASNKLMQMERQRRRIDLINEQITMLDDLIAFFKAYQEHEFYYHHLKEFYDIYKMHSGLAPLLHQFLTNIKLPVVLIEQKPRGDTVAKADLARWMQKAWDLRDEKRKELERLTETEDQL